MADLENSSALLKQALDELRKSGSLTADTLGKLNKSIKENNAAVDKNTKSQEEEAKEAEEAAKKLKETWVQAKHVVAAFGSLADNVRENREDFRSLKPAVDGFAAAAKLGAGKIGDGLSALGTIISGASLFLGPLGKVIGTGVGLAVSTLGDQVKKHGQEVVDFATQYSKFAIDEVQRVVGAYTELSKVGGVTAETFGGLQRDAQALGLSMDQYAKLIASNSQGLAFAAGSVTAGAKAVKDISVASRDFERDFLKLGIGFSEQRDLTAKFLSFQRLNTQVNLNDTKALSAANKNYIELVDELARLTGKSRDKIAGELEDARRELRYGASLEIAAMRGTEKSVLQAQKAFETFKDPSLIKGFKDLFGGPVSEEAIALQRATGGAAYDLGQDLQQGRISFEQYMESVVEAIKRNRGNSEEALQLEQSLGGLGTVLDKQFVYQRLLSKVTKEQIAEMSKTKQTQGEVTDANDEQLNTVIDAQVALRDFAVELDKIVSQRLFPILAGSVKQLTDVLLAGAEKVAEILGVEVKPQAAPAGGTTGGVGGGGAAQAPGTTGGGLKGAAAKNLNPGNLRFIGQEGATAGTSGFAKFESVDAGLVALAKDLNAKLTGKSRHGTLNTLSSLVSKYAPPNENDTKAYIQKMSSHMGLAPDATIPNDPTTLAKLMTGIIGIENYGDPKQGYQFRSGVQFGVAQALGVDPSKIGQFRYGGVASGPKSGYATMLHGTEAIVPLPNGRSIPVEMNSVTDKIGEQVGILEAQTTLMSDLVDLMRTSVSTQEKILKHQQ